MEKQACPRFGMLYFNRKGNDELASNFKEDNIEYDIIEPPEPSPDPQVPTAGAEFSSDETANGPATGPDRNCAT